MLPTTYISPQNQIINQIDDSGHRPIGTPLVILRLSKVDGRATL